MKWTCLNHKIIKKPKRRVQCRKRRTEQRDHVWVDLPIDDMLGPPVDSKRQQPC